MAVSIAVYDSKRLNGGLRRFSSNSISWWNIPSESKSLLLGCFMANNMPAGAPASMSGHDRFRSEEGELMLLGIIISNCPAQPGWRKEQLPALPLWMAFPVKYIRNKAQTINAGNFSNSRCMLKSAPCSESTPNKHHRICLDNNDFRSSQVENSQWPW